MSFYPCADLIRSSYSEILVIYIVYGTITYVCVYRIRDICRPELGFGAVEIYWVLKFRAKGLHPRYILPM